MAEAFPHKTFSSSIVSSIVPTSPIAFFLQLQNLKIIHKHGLTDLVDILLKNLKIGHNRAIKSFLGSIMFNRRLIGFIVLFCCFFESSGKNVKDRRTIGEALGKPVSIFVEITNFNKTEQFSYTTELSRILLVGEPQVLQSVRCLPFISGLINPLISLAAPLFDNRFENFIKNIERFSQKQLQEAIEDAILLSQYEYNTKAYSASKLLNLLSKALQAKIAYTQDQIKHDFKWDQKSFSSLKKSGAWAIGLISLVVITNKYIPNTNTKNKVSNLEALNAVATLGLLPVSYKVLKNCYKILTIDPNDCNQYLCKYEELLAFVQKLKAQLETNGFITFELANGRTATLKDNWVTFS
jgi:hypothetical protein